MSNAPQRHGIFLCYRREDSEDFASRLYDELADRFGHPRVFKDVDSLLPGFDWEDHLRDRLAEAAIVIVIIGPDWSSCTDAAGRRRLETADDHVRTEIESSLAERIPVIPLLIGQTHLPERTTLPESIHPLVRRQSFSIRRDQHFRPDVRLFIENLDRIFATLAAKAAAAPAAPPNPAAPPTGVTLATLPAPPVSQTADTPPPAAGTSLPSPSPLFRPARAPESYEQHVEKRPGPAGKLAAVIWCGWWYLASLLLIVPPLGAWWQAKLLRARAPSVHGWWPISSVVPTLTVLVILCVHDVDGRDYYKETLRFYTHGLLLLSMFIPQWALLHTGRVRWAWSWIAVPALAYGIFGFVSHQELSFGDIYMVPIFGWFLQGMIMGPWLYWLTRIQTTTGKSAS